jgi:hypothetical protein
MYLAVVVKDLPELVPMRSFDTSFGSAGSPPPAPHHLPLLLTRVERGIGRLVRDPGLEARHRVALSADLQFLNGIDPGDARRAALVLSAYLPRVIGVVDAVTPLYLRLRADLLALTACVEAILTREDRPARVAAAQGTSQAAQAIEPRRSEPIREGGARRPGVGPIVERSRSGGWSGALAHRAQAAAAGLLVGVAAVLAVLVVLVSQAMADGRLVAGALPLVALCALAAVAGLLGRVVAAPDRLPSRVEARLVVRPIGLASSAGLVLSGVSFGLTAGLAVADGPASTSGLLVSAAVAGAGLGLLLAGAGLHPGRSDRS